MQKSNHTILALAFIAILAVAAIPNVPTKQVFAAPITTITVKTQFADGATLTGMWNTITPTAITGGANGFSLKTYTINPNSNYAIAVGNYNDIVFHHWLDNNSTVSSRTVNVNSNATFTAIYTSNAHPLPSNQPPAVTTVPLSILSINQNGTAVSGVYTVITNNTSGAVMVAANTPMSINVKTGQSYKVQISPYEIFNTGSYTFQKWSDGSTSATRTVTVNQATTLTAIYKNNPLGLKTIAVDVKNGDTNEDLSGIFLDISPNTRANIADQYSPASWTLEADTAYTITPQDYGSYIFDHWSDGNVTRTKTFVPTAGLHLTAYFTVNADKIAPTVTIQSPQTTITSSQATISGLASDNVGVMRVEVSIDGQPFQKADGLSHWSYISHSGLLMNGNHTAIVRATDLMGNSGNATVSFNIAINPVLAKTGVYIPVYFNPDTPEKQAFYDQIAQAKRDHPSVPIVAAVNPASGPGSTYLPSLNTGIKELQDAGVIVIGYTPTKYGARPIDQVKAEMDTYRNRYNVTSYMLDEFANAGGSEQYYRDLKSYAVANGVGFVLGNAGADPPQSYVGTVDAIGITEGDGYPPTSWLHYCVTCSEAAGWHYKYDKNSFKFSRYAIDNLDPNFVHEASKWVGLFYVTNGVSPTRWNFLPPYFNDLVTLLDNQ